MNTPADLKTTEMVLMVGWGGGEFKKLTRWERKVGRNATIKQEGKRLGKE